MHYSWGEACESFILLAAPALSIKQEKMPPGSSEKLHYHEKAQQFFYILEGTATFYIEGEWIIAERFQGIRIKPLQKHVIKNDSAKDLEFLVISSPATDSDRTDVSQ